MSGPNRQSNGGQQGCGLALLFWLGMLFILIASIKQLAGS